MCHRMRLFIMSFLFFYSLLPSQTNAKNWELLYDASVGYREDQLAAHIRNFDPPTKLVSANRLSAKHIHIYEVGVSGRAGICGFCGFWFVKGFGTFGKVCNGRYNDVTTTILTNTKTSSKANIHGGNTLDVSLGLGLLFPVFTYFGCPKCYGVGPVMGYASNYQRIKIKNAITDDVKDPNLKRITYTNHWEGAWVGFETVFPFYFLEVDAGYEFHFPRWTADRILSVPDVKGGPFSDRRSARNGYGSTTFFNLSYYFCEDWYVESKFKFQYFRVKHGKRNPRAGFTAVGLNNTEIDKLKKANWKSFELQLDLGYFF